MRNLGIYVHVPFCNGKCPYCDFYSEAINRDKMDRYVYSVISHMNKYKNHLKDYVVSTIYFGGGTPSLLGERRLIEIIRAIKKVFVLADPEITVEVNPASYKQVDFISLRENGVNRVSIGVQSANDNELKILGRKHRAEDAETTINAVKMAGIDNISLDLMVAIPYQTKESLLRSIEFCASQNVQHISAYLLKVEEGTPYFKQKNSLALPDEEQTSDMYLMLCDELEKRGFKQYEISNFAVPHKQSRHNLKYWNCEEYLGLGPSAHSFINNRRFYYSRSIDDFLSNRPIINDGHGGSIEEYSMLRLRLNEGLRESEFKQKFGISIPDEFYIRARKYEKSGLVKINEDDISFTRRGFLVSNELICKIIL